MGHTASAVIGLAIVDSINPSAVAVTLWWLSRSAPGPRVLAYVTGIALTYLALGVALMLGMGALVEAYGRLLDHRVALTVQLMLGAGMLAFAVFAPKDRPVPGEPRPPCVGGLIGMMLLGMTVTAVELVTAFPYFAAIALMIAADWPPLQWLTMLLAYNVIFIAPPLALLGLHVLLGRRAQPRFARWRAIMQKAAREAMCGSSPLSA